MLYNLSFEVLSLYFDALLQTFYQKDKYYSWKVFSDDSKW